MSQNNSRIFQGSKNEASKYLRSQGAKNKHQHVPRNVHPTLGLGDQVKASFSSDFLKGNLDSNLGRPINGPLGDGEFTSLSRVTECPTACQSPDALLAHQNLDASCGCTGDVSRKTPDYAACSKMKNCIGSESLSETGQQTRTGKHEENCVNERNVNAVEKENKNIFRHQQFVTNTVAEGTEEMLPSAGVDIQQSQDSILSNLIPKCAKKACESKSFQPNSEYQRVFKRDMHPKLLSKKLGLSCLKPFSHAINILSSGSTDVTKSRSSVSINHTSPVVTWNQPFELSIFTSNSESFSDNEQSISAQLEMKFSDCIDHRHVCETERESKNNYHGSQSAHHLIAHSNKCPLSANQISQEHLQVCAENNSTILKGSKVKQIQQKFTQEKHQNTKDKTQYVHHNQNGNKSSPSTRKLQKYEKPYRQWYRVSRVLAADSKFIISLDDSSHVVSSSEKKTSLLEEKTEPLPLNEYSNMGVKSERFILKEPAKDALISDCSPDSHRACSLYDNPQAETSSGTNVSMSAELIFNNEKEGKNNMKTEEKLFLSSTALQVVDIDGEVITASSMDREDFPFLTVNRENLFASSVDREDLDASQVNCDDLAASQMNCEDIAASQMNCEDIAASPVKHEDLAVSHVNNEGIIASPVNHRDHVVLPVERKELNATPPDGKDHFCSVPVEGREYSIKLDDSKCHSIKPHNTKTSYRIERTKNKTFSDSKFRTTEVPTPTESSTQSHRKSSLQTFCPTKKKHLQKQITERCSSCDYRRNRHIMLDNTIPTFKPLNLVTGVSQITGPVSRDKGQVFRDLSLMVMPETKSLVKKRINRNHDIDKSPRQISSHITKISACDSLTVLRSNLMSKAKSYSRNSKHVSRSSSAADRRVEHQQSVQCKCHRENSVRASVSSVNSKKTLHCLKKHCNHRSEVSEVEQARLLLPTSSKLSIADVTSKLLQKVNRAGLHVHWSEPTKNFTDAQAPAEYKCSIPKPGHVRRNRHKINKDSSLCGLSDSYIQAGSLRRTQKDILPLH